MKKVKSKEGEKTVSCPESRDEIMIVEVAMVPMQLSFFVRRKLEWSCQAQETGPAILRLVDAGLRALHIEN